jgi:hypothetical protein
MPLVDLNKPGEKKKVIWAAVLGLVAIIFLWWTFFGFGSRTTARTTARATASPTPARAGQQANGTLLTASNLRQTFVTSRKRSSP